MHSRYAQQQRNQKLHDYVGVPDDVTPDLRANVYDRAEKAVFGPRSALSLERDRAFTPQRRVPQVGPPGPPGPAYSGDRGNHIETIEFRQLQLLCSGPIFERLNEACMVAFYKEVFSKQRRSTFAQYKDYKWIQAGRPMQDDPKTGTTKPLYFNWDAKNVPYSPVPIDTLKAFFCELLASIPSLRPIEPSDDSELVVALGIQGVPREVYDLFTNMSYRVEALPLLTSHSPERWRAYESPEVKDMVQSIFAFIGDALLIWNAGREHERRFATQTVRFVRKLGSGVLDHLTTPYDLVTDPNGPLLERESVKGVKQEFANVLQAVAVIAPKSKPTPLARVDYKSCVFLYAADRGYNVLNRIQYAREGPDHNPMWVASGHIAIGHYIYEAKRTLGLSIKARTKKEVEQMLYKDMYGETAQDNELFNKRVSDANSADNIEPEADPAAGTQFGPAFSSDNAGDGPGPNIRLFGPGFSSDNSGDGPGSGRSKTSNRTIPYAVRGHHAVSRMVARSLLTRRSYECSPDSAARFFTGEADPEASAMAAASAPSRSARNCVSASVATKREATVTVDFAVKPQGRPAETRLISIDTPSRIKLCELKEYYNALVEEQLDEVAISSGTPKMAPTTLSFLLHLDGIQLSFEGKPLAEWPETIQTYSAGGIITIHVRTLGVGGNGKKKVGGGGKGRGQTKKKIVQEVKKLAKRGVMAAGRAAGGYLGGQFGQANQGKKLGGMLVTRILRAVGSGDYTVNSDVAVNSLIKNTHGGSTATVAFGSQHGKVMIEHREYVKDIITPQNVGTFSIEAFEINPGNPIVFPYSSAFATRFEQYKFHGLIMEFISTTSPYNANSAMGSIIAAMQYNSTQAPYRNKAEMENSDYAVSTRFDKSMMYAVECKDQMMGQWLVSNPTDGGDDDTPTNFKNMGTFYWGMSTASTFPAESTLGEFWVAHQLELSKPIYVADSFGYARASIDQVIPPDVVAAQLLTPLGNTTLDTTSLMVDTGFAKPWVGRGALPLQSQPSGGYQLFTPIMAYDSSPGATVPYATAIDFFNAKTGDVYMVQLTMSGINSSGSLAYNSMPLNCFTNLTGGTNDPGDNLYLGPPVLTESYWSGSTINTLEVSGYVVYNSQFGTTVGPPGSWAYSRTDYVTIRRNEASARPVLYYGMDVITFAFLIQHLSANVVITYCGNEAQDF